MLQDDFNLITFDCYGTLIDWESGIIRAFRAEAARDGLALDPDAVIDAYMIEEPLVEAERYRPYREILALTAQRVAARLGWEIDLQRAGFLPEGLGQWRSFPDTGPALERLAGKYQLGILSNVDDDLLAATQRHFSVPFDLVVTAAQVKAYKPALNHFHEALARAGTRKLLHAAQSYVHDVIPACRVNIPVVWVNRKRERVDARGPRPTWEVPDLTALADLLGC